MAINNPYVPGDPYSYDLKWLVRKVREHTTLLSTLPEQIREAIIQLLDQHDPVYWSTASDLVHSDMRIPSIAYIEGFYEPGDGGANLYYLTSDYNDVLSSDFYITLDGANRWAIPIIVTPFVMPEMFGAVGDGTTDDGIAIQTCAIIADKLKADIITKKKKYLISDTVTIDGTNIKNIILDGTIKCSQNDRPGVKFINCEGNNIKISVAGSAYNGGYNTIPVDFDIPLLPFVGALFVNASRCRIDLNVLDCEVGARFLAENATGSVFNTVEMGLMANCAINLEIVTDSSGWFNDNLFLNGSFTAWSDNTFRQYHVDIRQRTLDNVYEANNNVFIKPSFEGHGLPIYLDYASFNQFKYIRQENGTTYYAKVVKGRDNVFDGGYAITLPKVEPVGDYARQWVKNIKTSIIGDLVLLHKWEFKKEENVFFRGSGSVYYARTMPGIDEFAEGYASPESNYYGYSSAVVPETEGITAANSLVRGFYVDVTGIKTLYMRFLNADGSNTGRFSIRFFDSSWNTIQPQTGTKIMTDGNYGIYYQNQHLVTTPETYAGTFFPIYFLDSSVKYVFVGVTKCSCLTSIEAYTTLSSVSTNDGGRVFTRQLKTGEHPVYYNTDGIKAACVKGRVIPNAPQVANGDGSYNFAYVCTDASTQTWAPLKSGI